MGTIPSQTDRATVDGTEYVAGAAGGVDYKVLISKIKDFVLSFFSNKIQLDKIGETGGLPVYNSKPFGSLVQTSAVELVGTNFTLDLAYSRIWSAVFDTATNYTVSFPVINEGVVMVIRATATADITFTWDAAIKWVDGEALTELANGEEARIYIVSDGTTEGEITINWVKVSTYNSGS